MPNWTDKFGQEFRVNRVTDKMTDTDMCMSIHKRQEFVAYRAHVSPQNALISYASSPTISVDDNLSIVDRSTVLPGNRVVTSSEYTLVTSALTFTSDTDRILITDIFTTETSTQSSVPLFFKHVIPSDHFDPDQGHKIVSLRILDDTLTEIAVAEKYTDYDNGVIYNNLEHSYDSTDKSFAIYYVQYSVKESVSKVSAYTVLLDNQSVYSQAELEDVSESGGLSGSRPVYLVEELTDGSFEFTLPSSQTYAYKKLVTSRLAVLPPVSRDISSPWYVRVSDGRFFATVNSSVYKYHIAEILSQSFVPYMPYRYAQNEPATYLNKNLLHLAHPQVYESEDEGLYLNVFVYDSEDNLKYAMTTDVSKHGTWAGTGANNTTIYFSCLEYGGASYGIRSVDHRWGFVDIQGVNLLESDILECSYYYSYSDLEISSVNFNPVSNQDIVERPVILFLVPDAVFATSTQSVYLLVTDENGRVISSDWDTFDTLTDAGKYLFYQEAPDWFKDQYGESNCVNFLETYTVNGGSTSYAYLILGEVYVKASQGIEDIELMDIRRGGGGLAPNSPQRDTEDAKRCWDLGNLDGEPYPGAGAYLVEIPITIMENATGNFRSDEIRNVVERHTAVGVYPVIRAYGIDPRITSVTPGDGTIEIEWTNAASDVYYNVYLSNAKDGDFVAQNSTPLLEDASGNSYKILGLTNDTPYYIFVVGGRYVDGTWTPLSEQIVGVHYPVAKGVNTLEYVKCIPGLPRNSNLLGQEFDITIT